MYRALLGLGLIAILPALATRGRRRARCGGVRSVTDDITLVKRVSAAEVKDKIEAALRRHA